MTLKIASNDIKNLNRFINEENEFKRFILCQLWITQQYTGTINDTITKTINNVKGPLSDSIIYNILRDIKQKLTDENERLSLVVQNLQNTFDLVLVMDEVLGLNMKSEDGLLNEELEKLKLRIKNNVEYIDKINNLSENQIAQIRSKNENSQN